MSSAVCSVCTVQYSRQRISRIHCLHCLQVIYVMYKAKWAEYGSLRYSCVDNSELPYNPADLYSLFALA